MTRTLLFMGAGPSGWLLFLMMASLMEPLFLFQLDWLFSRPAAHFLAWGLSSLALEIPFLLLLRVLD